MNKEESRRLQGTDEGDGSGTPPFSRLIFVLHIFARGRVKHPFVGILEPTQTKNFVNFQGES